MANEENRAEDSGMEIAVRAIRVIGSLSSAWKWMDEPKPEFDNASPRELLQTDIGREKVARALDNREREQAEQHSGDEALAG